MSGERIEELKEAREELQESVYEFLATHGLNTEYGVRNDDGVFERGPARYRHLDDDLRLQFQVWKLTQAVELLCEIAGHSVIEGQA